MTAVSPEVLIESLRREIEQLKEKLEQAEANVKDFEVLALEWKRSYGSTERGLRIKIEHLEQTIEELKAEAKILESKNRPG